jgi:hypothetical protein
MMSSTPSLLANFNFQCQRCFDTGIWLTPKNDVETCPVKIMMPGLHLPATTAAGFVKRAADLIKNNQAWINFQEFDLARILSNYSSANPCARQILIEFFYDETNLTAEHKLRKFHSLIECLRHRWLLPIGSRKTEPTGYWIISDVEDCKAWLRHATAAPKTQLATIWHVAKHNFPMLAGQAEFDFMNHLETEVTE